MTRQEIPPDVRQLLHDHVETYAQLEIVGCLAADCDRWRTTAELAAELEIPVASVNEAADHLLRSGLIEETARGGQRVVGCEPDGRALALLTRLADAYKVHRLEVINLMSTNALERMRTAAMRAFARAFLLGKRDDL